MPRDAKYQAGFNSGVLSPFMGARSDVDRYAYGARTMENFIPMLQGPARKRPGFKYVHDLKEKCFLMPLTFSQTDAWILAFGDSKVKFFTDQGPVLETAVPITSMTNASPGVFTRNSHGLAVDEEIYIPSLPGTTGIAERIFVVNTVPTANTFTLKDMWGTVLDTTSAGTYTGSGEFKRLYAIVSPYPIADLFDATTGCWKLSWAQSEDVTYICVPGYQPQKLTRTASTNWAFTDFEPEDGPFIGVDPDETITIQASAATGTGVTLTASSAIFTSDHVGSLFLVEKPLVDSTAAWEAAKVIGSTGLIRRSQGHYYSSGTTGTTGTVTPSHTEGSRMDGDAGVRWDYHHSGYGWVEITAIGGGGTTATVDVIGRIPALSVSGTTTQWSFGAWSDDAGWPTHVCFFRERLCFARGTKLWLSVPSDFENFAERDAGVIADDSAIAIDIRQGFNDSIQWIVPTADLLVGSEGNEFAVGEISTADPLGPGNIASLRGPGYGARRVQPALVNDGVFYALPSGRVVRELRFAFESDGYVALNRTAFAEHITKGAVNQLIFAKEPESIVWSPCANGALIAMSFEREHNLLAWHNHVLGGAFSSSFPVNESGAVIPSPQGDRDELYLCVKRTINGATKHYLEYLAAHWDESTDALSAQFYVDSGLSDAANASLTVGGLEHLIGQSVMALGDGRVSGPYTVSATGTITLSGSTPPTVLHVGLTYTATLESMDLHRPDFLKNIKHAFVKFVSTVFANAGGYTTTDRDTRKPWSRALQWTFQGYSVSAAYPAQTRTVKVDGEGEHGREVTFQITHDKPTACTVAGWMLDTEEAKA